MTIRIPAAWPPLNLFWERVSKEPNGCWIWTGAITGRKGEQVPIICHQGVRYNARRWAWAILRGTPRFQLRRTCSGIFCVNPEHHFPWGTTLRCKYGHMLTENNLYVVPKTGKRECRLCVRRNQMTPRQKELRAINNRLHLERETPEQREKRRATSRKHDQRRRLARTIDRKSVFWSPNANRWFIWDGDRWVQDQGEKPALWAINKFLKERGVLPKDGHAAARFSEDIMARLKRVRKLDQEAA